MARVVTRTVSSSPSPKKGESTNPKGKGKNKAISIKSKGETMGSQLVRGSNLKLVLKERRRKQKGLSCVL